MDDTKKLIEKYKRELMELSRSSPKPSQTAPAAKPAKPTPEPREAEEKSTAKSPKVIGYVSEESGEFPAVFDRIIAQAVENNEVEVEVEDIEITRRDSPEGYPDIDSVSAEDEVAFSAGRAPRDTSADAPAKAPANNPENAANNAPVGAPENSNPDSMGRPEDNMNQGTGESISNFPVSTYSTYEEFEAENTGGGSLEFMVFTAREALPVEGAAITITTRIDGEQHTMFNGVTNQSGETESITLPAPSKELSQDFDNDIQPFSLYDATVSKDGFTKVILRDIPVFDGVRSIQRVAMIPELADNERNTNSPAEEISEVRNAK